MIWENLKDTLVQTDLMAENEQEIFEQLGGGLVSEGCCKESYVSSLAHRFAMTFRIPISMGAMLSDGTFTSPVKDAS